MSELCGVPHPYDRHWRIVTPDFEATVTDYNWEVTGYSEALADVLRYGANAYWFLLTECPSRGWRVEKVPRAITSSPAA